MRTLSKITVYLLLIIAVEFLATYLMVYKGTDSKENKAAVHSIRSDPDSLDHHLKTGIIIMYKAKADKVY